MYGSQDLGILEINYPHETLFQSEIRVYREKIDEALEDDPEYYEDQDVASVLQALTDTRAIIALQVFLSNRSEDEIMTLIDPVWKWLDANRPGLLHVENIGFEREFELVLE